MEEEAASLLWGLTVSAAAKLLTPKLHLAVGFYPLYYTGKTVLCLLSHPPPLPASICHCTVTAPVQLFCTERKINWWGVTVFAERILLVYQLKKPHHPSAWHSRKCHIDTCGANVGTGALVLVGKLRRNWWPKCRGLKCSDLRRLSSKGLLLQI